jgi:hypothetical protein
MPRLPTPPPRLQQGAGDTAHSPPHDAHRSYVSCAGDTRPCQALRLVTRYAAVVLHERRVFLLIRLRAPPAYAAQTCARQQAGCYQGDIITAIAARQPSRMLRSSRLPSPGPLASEPAEIQGPLRKRNLSLQPGTAFAERDPDKVPRPRGSQV